MKPNQSQALRCRAGSYDLDTGTRYHLKRLVECVKAAPSTLYELKSLAGVPR
jgi:hypothetical protein